VTICTDKKKCLFGSVRDGKVHLNELGKIVLEEWLRTAQLRTSVTIDDFKIMPNHMHSVIVIVKCGEPRVNICRRQAGPKSPAGNSLGAIVANFKAAVTKRIRRLVRIPDFVVWQRDYYDHIIRDGDDWEHIREYILQNPNNWPSDPENPHRVQGRPAGRP
jgi:putative transposase